MADDVKFSGPMFDGRADAALARGIKAIRADLASEGEKLAAAAFTASIKANHGKFVSRMRTTDHSAAFTTQTGSKSYTLLITTDSAAETIVTNDLATYGPWLEGTGSRNTSTRFKGYHGMRRAGQALNGVAAARATATLRPYVGEMNA
jgi:hypothetical protein